MCIMCDGGTYDEWLFSVHAGIHSHGWSIGGVSAGPEVVPWSYTIGLVDGFDHPELLVVGMAERTGGHLLNALGGQIRGGARFGAESVAEATGHLFTFGPVDPDQFDTEVFNGWTGYYDALDRRDVPRAALQVFPPRCLVRYGGEPERWSLAGPAPVLGGLEPGVPAPYEPGDAGEW